MLLQAIGRQTRHAGRTVTITSSHGEHHRAQKLAGSPEPQEEVALDSTHVKAHRCAGGGKGGPRNGRSASLRAAATASFMRLSINYADRG